MSTVDFFYTAFSAFGEFQWPAKLRGENGTFSRCFRAFASVFSREKASEARFLHGRRH
jgi:hypothetical protein